jgi:hypothetical protein
MPRYLASIAASAIAMACSSSTVPGAKISVGGTYQTAVVLVSSTCAGQTVEQHPTVVTQSPGSTSLSLSHAGSSYSGTLLAGGSFTTTTSTQVFDNISYQITIAGQFSLTGMDATVQVAAARQPPCSFTARWAGAKDGAPNVLP